MADTPDEKLVRRAQKGDKNAFAELFIRYEGRIFGYLYRMVGNRDWAEDLAQEAFIQAHQHLNKLGPPYDFKSWVYRIAGNLALDGLRRYRREVPLPDWDSGEASRPELADQKREGAPESQARLSEVRSAVWNTLHQLPDNYRQILVLREIDGLAYNEIAAALGLSLNNVRVTLHRARLRFRDIYELQAMVQEGRMTCQELDDLLSAYVDDELDRSMRKQVKAHIKTCPACQKKRRDLLAVGSLLVVLAPLVPPPTLQPRLLHRLQQSHVSGQPQANQTSNQPTQKANSSQTSSQSPKQIGEADPGQTSSQSPKSGHKNIGQANPPPTPEESPPWWSFVIGGSLAALLAALLMLSGWFLFQQVYQNGSPTIEITSIPSLPTLELSPIPTDIPTTAPLPTSPPSNAPVTSTPRPTYTPTPTPTFPPPSPTFTPIPTLTPYISFQADALVIPAGSCTTVRWQTSNVQAVHFNGNGVSGTGTHQTCPCKDEIHTLDVTLLDGSHDVRKIAIQVTGSCISPTPDVQSPPAPRVLSPIDDVVYSCRSLTTLSWNATYDPSGIAGYYVRLERRTGTNTWQSEGLWGPLNNTQINVPVDCGYGYRWAVRAEDNVGNMGFWSSWALFGIGID
jgi:RNA polymerase sigma-70 factor (ECF subfamily)